MMKYRCEVCGKFCNEKKTRVACSPLFPITRRYCIACFNKGLEPYNDLVDLLACSDLRWPDDVNSQYKQYIKAILNKQKISEEKFAEDVASAIMNPQ